MLLPAALTRPASYIPDLGHMTHIAYTRNVIPHLCFAYMPCSTCHFSVKVCWWEGTTGFLSFVCKSLDITFTYQECIASKGGSGEGVAFAIANLSLLSTASQDLVNVLSCKGLLFLFGFVFLANLRVLPP